jgi:hypothetical protein
MSFIVEEKPHPACHTSFAGILPLISGEGTRIGSENNI